MEDECEVDDLRDLLLLNAHDLETHLKTDRTQMRFMTSCDELMKRHMATW